MVSKTQLQCLELHVKHFAKFNKFIELEHGLNES